MDERRNSLYKNTIYYLLYNTLNILFPFISGIYVSHVLTPEGIGSVTVAQNLVQYFIIFAFLGIPTYGIREIAKTRNNSRERNQVYSELFFINLISTSIFAVVYSIVVFNIPVYRINIELYLIVGLLIVLNAFNNTWLFEGMESFRLIALRNLIFKVISFGFLVIFVRKQEDILSYALVSVIGTFGNCIVNMCFTHLYVKLSIRQLNLKRHMKSIIYLVAVNLAIEIYSLIDITMMGFLCDKASVAYYKYGQSTERVLLQIINTFTMVTIPRLSSNFKEKKMIEFNRIISQTFKVIIMVSVPTIIGIFFTADYLYILIYGNAYIESANILKILSLLVLVSPIGYLLGSRVLLVTDNENQMIFAVSAGALINILGNSFLIPRFSIFGASISSVISEIVMMIIYVNLGKRYYQFKEINNDLRKIGLANLAIFFYLLAFRMVEQSLYILILQIVGSMILYFGVLYIVKENEVITCIEKVIKHRQYDRVK